MESRSIDVRHVLGQVNFVLFVNPKDCELQAYAEVLKQFIKSDIIQ